MSCKHKVEPWKFCPKCSFNVHVGYIKKQDDKIADLERQLAECGQERSDLIDAGYDLVTEKDALKDKLAEATRVIELQQEYIELLNKSYGGPISLDEIDKGNEFRAKIKEAQDFLKGE